MKIEKRFRFMFRDMKLNKLSKKIGNLLLKDNSCMKGLMEAKYIFQM